MYSVLLRSSLFWSTDKRQNVRIHVRPRFVHRILLRTAPIALETTVTLARHNMYAFTAITTIEQFLCCSDGNNTFPITIQPTVHRAQQRFMFSLTCSFRSRPSSIPLSLYLSHAVIAVLRLCCTAAVLDNLFCSFSPFASVSGSRASWTSEHTAWTRICSLNSRAREHKRSYAYVLNRK